jgi:hypothetical protein
MADSAQTLAFKAAARSALRRRSSTLLSIAFPTAELL